MKKIIIFPFIFLVILTMITPVFAAKEYGKVTDITQKAGDSLSSGQGTLTTVGDTTTIRYSTATFKMLDADPGASGGSRPGPAAWIGFEVTEPSDDNDSSFKVTLPDKSTQEIKKSSFSDYVGITPDNLKKALLNGTVLTYKYSFDWNEDNTPDQYVIIEVDPEKVTLEPTKGGDNVWSPEMAQEILKDQNPSTGDINLPLFLGLIVLGGTGLIYYFKKA